MKYRVYRITPQGNEINIGRGWSLEDAKMVKSVWEKESGYTVFIALDA